jgi:hypothetical protein
LTGEDIARDQGESARNITGIVRIGASQVLGGQLVSALEVAGEPGGEGCEAVNGGPRPTKPAVEVNGGL